MGKILILLSFCTLTACGSGFLGVALESMTVSKVDGYFDLDREQRGDLKKQIREDLRDFRKQVLPKVASSLRNLDRQVKLEEPTPVDFADFLVSSKNSFKTAAGQFQHTAVQLSTQLSTEQFEYFQRKITNEINETAQKTATARTALKQSVKSYKKSLEFWFGDLTKEQEVQLTSFLKAHPYPWILQTENKRQLVKRLMEVKNKPSELQSYVGEFFADYESVRLPAFKAALENHQRAFEEFLNDTLWLALTRDQRKEFKENLITRASKLEDLARKP